ncbi:MAG: ABC transporter permease [Bacteroidales bacterium]|nr:ABC transporter permease [Bacteroidales bacterium]
MKFSFYVALRYLFSKKSHNAINLISLVSVIGIAIASMALVCTLSVYNGFNDLISSLFSTFDPDLKITPEKGKTFVLPDEFMRTLTLLEGVETISPVIEGNVLVKYNDRQVPAIIKGVADNFAETTKIDSILLDGTFVLKDEIVNYANFGAGLASLLGVRSGFVYPVELYVPKRNATVNLLQPASSFSMEAAYIGAVFATNQQVYDDQYMLVPLELTRTLFDYDKEITALEIKAKKGTDIPTLQKEIKNLLGGEYVVKDRYQQQETSFKMMKIEKWITYLTLSFILMIAIFNVVGSLSMLIIEKKNDAATLRSLGADKSLISSIFLLEGWLISLFGALLGIISGVLLCLAQSYFGLLRLSSVSGTFVIDAYPVRVDFMDIFYILLTVLFFGWFSAWYPVRYALKSHSIG